MSYTPFGQAWILTKQEQRRLKELEKLALGRPDLFKPSVRRTTERAHQKTFNIGRSAENDPAREAFLKQLRDKRGA